MPTRHIARNAFSGVSLIALFAFAQPALAATFNVTNETELAAAITTANSNGDTSNTINVIANITLTAPLPPLGLRDTSGQPLATSPLTINGNGNTVSGGGTQRIFFANTGEIAINDVTLADGRAKGGDGGTGGGGQAGGGGLGAGGALFVRGADAGADTGASVTLSGVAFAGNQSIGGKGGADDSERGASKNTGGGGGLGGDGGTGFIVGNGGGGGGGGAFAGQNGSATGTGYGGGAYGGVPNRLGGDLSGGGGIQYGVSGGGNGAGGFGGGGGGGGSSGLNGGSGGFGGGGGGDLINGGQGGFGGGGGGGVDGGGGSGGFAAGSGGSGHSGSAGGGGGALGGGLFVAEGGSLTIVSGSISGGGVTGGLAGAVGGTGGALPTSGQAAGSGIFLQGSGTATFSPTAGKTVTVSDAISDELGFLAPNPGYAAPSGFTAGAWGLKKTGTGTLTLSGSNTYAGGTTLSQGTLSLGNSKALGSGTLFAASGTTTDIQNGVNIGNALIIDLKHTINVDGVAAGTYSGTTSEASANSVLHKTGHGMLTLSGTSAHTGGTVVDAGTLKVGSRSALGSGALTVAGGATVDLSGVDLTVAGISGAGNLKLGSSDFTVGTNNQDSVFSGSILGGNVGKVGSGTLTLSGSNSFGSMVVGAGTLMAGSNSAIDGLSLIVTKDAIVDLAGFEASVGNLSGAGGIGLGTGRLTAGWKHDSTFSGTFSGSGRVDKAGSGTLTLTGDSSAFAGTTQVSSGTLTVGVDGVGKLGGAVNVQAGARLGGSGTIGGNVSIARGATHGVGNSVGTQTINGNYVNRGTLEIEATPAGADRLNVNGTVDISGAALQLLLSPPTSTAWNVLNGPFVLIANDGGEAVTGTFGSVGDLNKLVFLDHLINYAGGDGNDVTLTLIRNDVSVGDVGQSRNQIATGTAVDGLATNNPVRAALILSTDEGQVRAALDALSGEVHASLSGSFIEAGGQLRDVASSRIRSAFGDVAAAGMPVMAYGEGGAEFVAADSDRFVAWGQALGNWRSADGDGNAASFSHSGGGMLAGGDAMVGDSFRFGLLGGYSRTSFEASGRASSGSSDNFHLGVYGGGEWGGLGLRTGASYARHSVETTRNVVFPGFSETLKADYDAGTAQAFVEAGYRTEMGRVAFEPFAGLAYVSTSTDAFTETGSSAALTSAGVTNAATLTTLGLRAATDFTLGDARGSVRGMAGWRHAFGDVAPSSLVSFAGGDSFTIHGTPIAREALLLEAGFDVAISPKARLGLNYTGQLASSAREHGVKASLGVKF